MKVRNGTPIATCIAPVMYRPLAGCPADHSSSGCPAGRTTNKWPSKGKNQPGSLNRSGGNNHRPCAWEASDKCGSETPLRIEWRFLRLAQIFHRGELSAGSPRPAAGNIPAPNVHLPQVNLRCSIRVAYQAADAGHPDMGRASSPLSQANLARQYRSYQSVRGESSYRKGHHLRKAQPRRIDSGARMELKNNSRV